MRKTVSLLFPMLAATAATVALADPAPAATPGPAAPAIYRFDISVTSLDDAPKAGPATYSLELADDTAGSIETGANVPVPGNAATRMNVGVKLGLRYRLYGNALAVRGEFELTTADAAAPAGFHRVRAEGTAAATADTAVKLASVFDVQTHKRYDITVTPHRVL